LSSTTKFITTVETETEIRPKQNGYNNTITTTTTSHLTTKKTGENNNDFIDPSKRNCINEVHKYHENLYSKLLKYKNWLEETQGDPRIGRHYNKKVKTPEDLDKLNQLIHDLRTEKSELFLDFTFHRKPRQLPIREYINEFLRVKGVFNYYTFISWYRITVYSESGDIDCQELELTVDKEGKERREYPRKEYLIIPLYIRLKKNKVYDQFKSVHYTNASGTDYEVKPVNPQHFLRDNDPNSREQDEKNRDTYENKFTASKLDTSISSDNNNNDGDDDGA